MYLENFKKIDDEHFVMDFRGDSSETKPLKYKIEGISNPVPEPFVAKDSLFAELDTGKVHWFNGTAWKEWGKQ